MLNGLEMVGIRCLLMWQAAKSHVADRARDERGEVAPWIIIVGIMVVAAIGAAVLISTAVSDHANNVKKSIDGAQTS